MNSAINANTIISLGEYLKKHKQFVIPNYQRGYVWGKNNNNGGKDAVTYMMDSLIGGYDRETDVFIQGVTVSEDQSDIILIDGQQRTTFFYLLLKSLNFVGTFSIHYDIRTQSDDFLKSGSILDNIEEDKGEEYQDIYFFKKTLRIIREKLHDITDPARFLEYVLDHVKFLYIVIPVHKATTVFTMMNGNKAEMKPEELIKAELLRLASLNETAVEGMQQKELYAIEWDNNMLRSRYAREWDKWLQWWNRADVTAFYGVDRVIGLLAETYMKKMKPYEKFSFENFRNTFLYNGTSIQAKRTFDGLRRLQKRFEDAFNDAQTYNRIGAIIRIKKDERDKFIQWYFTSDTIPSPAELDRYYKWTFINLTHDEIVNIKQDAFEMKYARCFDIISSNDLYNENKEEAFRLLLRLNIDEDNQQEDGRGRKFDFSIWDRHDSRGRSLEHIYPKSKVYHTEMNEGIIVYKDGTEKENELPDTVVVDNAYISRESCRTEGGTETASEHSIGNLVLLYKDENSSFNDSSFYDKKAMFFKIPKKNEEDRRVRQIFKSRHLLHTIYKFAHDKWDGEEIANNKLQTLNDFKEYYDRK